VYSKVSISNVNSVSSKERIRIVRVKYLALEAFRTLPIYAIAILSK
jgi:hypothetical protein